MARFANGTLIIKSEDIERVVAAQPENTSNARAYFKQTKLKNSTHIAASEIKREYGNVPVVVRGDTGVTPKHGLDVTDIVPMPVEIDDKISAVESDELERATGEGLNQIVDDYLGQHADMVRNTVNALCCQAHKGSIDYMMKTGSGFERYQVNYGTVKSVSFGKALASLTIGDAVKDLASLRKLCVDQGVGGQGEFIAAADVYAKYVDLLAAAKQTEAIKDGWLQLGPYKVLEDNDSYVDVAKNGSKTTKSICDAKEVVYRALSAGQKLCYLRLDDVVQKTAVPIYSFTEKGEGQRGVRLYTKSKPFPLVNVKGLSNGKYQ
ncbi:MAG: hypothetical protein IK015_04535 [Treponema sp.]|nr:hypothetical protein [Treponema sp.]